jgi:hypothetical protein
MVDGNMDEISHVTTALESDCDMSQCYIVRISHRSIVDAILNKHPQMSSATLGLPRAPKALLLQYIVVGKLNMEATRKLSQTSGFVPMTLIDM